MMGIPEAIVYYLIRLVIFTVVAGCGIAIGIKLRKNKNDKVILGQNEEQASE